MGVAYQDYYEILGVDRKANEKEIKSAYRKLARKWHPDLHSGKDKGAAEEKIKLINEAYEVLSDQDKRNKYDRLGANWRTGQDFQPPPDMNGFRFYSSADDEGLGGFSDFFETLFGGGGFVRNAAGSRQAGPLKGQDIEAELEITLEEAYWGSEKSIQFSTTTGVKSLAVKIPPGVNEGSRIRLKGQGSDGLFGGSKGDLYLTVRIKPHPVYKVIDSDLETEISLRPEQAVLGGQVTVPTLDGSVNMKIPPGIQAGKRMRLRGKGMSFRAGRGDQYIKIKIDIPTDISEEEMELYRQIALLREEKGGETRVI